MATITQGATTITPDLVLGYEVGSDSRNVFHDILNRAEQDVSLAPESLRSGDLQLFFLTRAAGWAAYTLHTQLGSFVFIDASLPEIGMTYVREGGMKLTLDKDTVTRWILTVGFKEVQA